MNKMIIFGVTLVFFGTALLLRSLKIVEFSLSDFFGYVWPMALIFLGIALIVRKRNQDIGFGDTDPVEVTIRKAQKAAEAAAKSASKMAEDLSASVSSKASAFSETAQADAESERESSDQYRSYNYSYTTSGTGQTGKGKFSKAFGDLTIDFNGQSLQSNQISTTLGDLEVTLHGGQLEDGLNRMIISGFLGDIRINIPVGFEVSVQASNFIGDLNLLGRNTDGLANSACIQTPDYTSSRKRLHIAINTFLGDIRVVQL